MFQARRDVLRSRNGTLAETPLPLLLQALSAEERSATLELSLRNLVKRVHVEAGAPVACESNLLHETFGPVLVAKGKLTDAQHHQLLSESAATGKPLQSLLVEKQLISGFELFKLMQGTLARTLLDAFRWADAKWKLVDLDEVQTPIKLNVAQLVYTGCQQLPPETLTRHFSIDPTRPLALAAPVLEELKLGARDLRLVQALKRRASLESLRAVPGFTADEVTRRVYALCVLDFVDFAEVVDVRGPQATVETPAAPVSAVPAVATAPSVDAPALLDALAQEFLSHRGKDAFELLSVGVDAQVPALGKAFLTKAAALAPGRFLSPEAVAKAETLLLAYARAYGALVEPEQHALHRTRRENRLASRKAGGPNPAAAADAFKIKTELLDARAQFEEGRRRLEQGELQSAIEHLAYAADIEPTGRTLAYLALARFRQAPDFALERSLQLLAEACQRDASCEEAWAFRADLALSVSRNDEAAEAYRQAARLNPRNARYAQALKHLAGR